MNILMPRFLSRLPVLFWCLAVMIFPWAARAVETSQTLKLVYGWNAVWLQVAPVHADGTAMTVDQVFVAPQFRVDQVASVIRPVGTAEFSTNQQTLFSRGGWKLWKSTSVSGENPSILAQANQSYLVHVTPLAGQTVVDGDPAGELSIRGVVEFARPEWTKGGYNLVGFGLLGAPTFNSLLAASGIVVDSGPGLAPAVLKLEAAGDWVGVSGGEPVEDGRAYWINVPYDMPGKGYAGPVAVDFTGAALGVFDFGPGPGTRPLQSPNVLVTPKELTFSNLERTGAVTHDVTIRRLLPAAGADGADDLRVMVLEPVPNQLAWQAKNVSLAAGWQAASLASGRSTTVTLGADRNWSAGASEREHLCRIEVALNGGSVFHFLPLSASNPDLPPSATTGELPPDNPSTGLWLGQVLLDSVTSLTVADAPVQPASSMAPMRILVHVDAAGRPVLLSHVILMQTKTASPQVSAEPVLVVNESQISQFEGIQERAGKKVGIRYETVSFDMPRDLRAAVQPASVISSIQTAKGYTTAAMVTDADVNGYFSLDTRESRPTDLQEIYYPVWPLGGQLGAGMTLTTAQSLGLDPFHRSNPFRHAFNPQHTVGYDITRSFQITFEATQEPGLLNGSYRETTRGLARQDLVSTGRIVLRRVSRVATLY